MRITAFIGSHEGKKSVTNKMVQEILAGAAEAGAETQIFILAEKNISYCRACTYCLNVELHKCIIEDDMAEMIQSFRQSEVVIYATPLYSDNVSGMMKVFFDRLLSMVSPYVGKDENGEYRHVDKPGFSKAFGKMPKIVAVSNAAFPEIGQFQVISHLFKRMARNFHTEVIAEIYRGAGGVLKIDAPGLIPLIEGYYGLLRKAGREIAVSLKLSEGTKQELERPLFSDDAYVSEWNKMIDNTWAGKL